MNIQDEEIDMVLREKCHGIIFSIDEKIKEQIREHVTPKYLLLNSCAYIALMYALGREVTESDCLEYRDMKIIVHRSVWSSVPSILILGSTRDEMGHIINFNPFDGQSHGQ